MNPPIQKLSDICALDTQHIDIEYRNNTKYFRISHINAHLQTVKKNPAKTYTIKEPKIFIVLAISLPQWHILSKRGNYCHKHSKTWDFKK